MEKHPQKLLDQVQRDLRLRHYSIRTEQSYVSWIKRYIRFHNMKHPRQMGKTEIPSRVIGDLTIEELKTLDPVSYNRYAIVYLGLDDLESVRAEIDRLLGERE